MTKLRLAGGRDIGLDELLQDPGKDTGVVASLEVIRDIAVREGRVRPAPEASSPAAPFCPAPHAWVPAEPEPVLPALDRILKQISLQAELL